MAFFSLVIPTRDRPLLIRETLSSMLKQTFDDFEIVISDNPTHSPCEDIVKSFNDSRILYSRTETPLSLNSNWERALSFAQGKYAGIFLDKALVQPHCLQKCHDILKKSEDIDIISWPREVFYPQTDDITGKGRYHGVLNHSQKPVEFSPFEEWRRRLSFKNLRDGKGDFFHRGKIVFGFYSLRLINEIREQYGPVFPPFFPDYTSLSYALALGRKGVDLMDPMILGIQPKTSTGISLDKKAGFLEEFLASFDNAEELYKELPFPDILVSQHNIAARDYYLATKAKDGRKPDLNIENLAKCIEFDIEKSPIDQTSKEILKNLILKSGHSAYVTTPQAPILLENKSVFIKKIISFFLRCMSKAGRVSGTSRFIDRILCWPNKTISIKEPDIYPNIHEAFDAQRRYHGNKFMARLHIMTLQAYEFSISRKYIK